jgi:hypothetical protein
MTMPGARLDVDVKLDCPGGENLIPSGRNLFYYAHSLSPAPDSSLFSYFYEANWLGS